MTGGRRTSPCRRRGGCRRARRFGRFLQLAPGLEIIEAVFLLEAPEAPAAGRRRALGMRARRLTAWAPGVRLLKPAWSYTGSIDYYSAADARYGDGQ